MYQAHIKVTFKFTQMKKMICKYQYGIFKEGFCIEYLNYCYPIFLFRAHLWYVPVKEKKEFKEIAEVPPLTYASPEQEEQGRLRYEAQKATRTHRKKNGKDDQVILCLLLFTFVCFFVSF